MFDAVEYSFYVSIAKTNIPVSLSGHVFASAALFINPSAYEMYRLYLLFIAMNHYRKWWQKSLTCQSVSSVEVRIYS